MKSLLCMFAAGLVAAAVGQDYVRSAPPRDFWRIKAVSPVRQSYFLGEAIPISLLCDKLFDETPLTVSGDGSVDLVIIQLADAQGQVVKERPYTVPKDMNFDFPGDLHQYVAAPGDSLWLYCDLNDGYALPRAGEYRLAITDLTSTKFEARFTILPTAVLGRRDVVASCAPFPALSVASMNWVARQTPVAVTWGNAGDAQKGFGFVATEYLGFQRPVTGPSLRTKRDSVVGRAVLDVKWQLWVELANGKEHALEILDIANQRTAELVGWTTGDLVLDYTLVNHTEDAYFVFAGLKDKPKFSTANNPLLDRPPAVQLQGPDGKPKSARDEAARDTPNPEGLSPDLASPTPGK